MVLFSEKRNVTPIMPHLTQRKVKWSTVKYHRNLMNAWGLWGYGPLSKGPAPIFIPACSFASKRKGLISRNIYTFFFAEDVLLRRTNVLRDTAEMKRWMILSKQFIKRKANEKIIVPQIRVNSLLSFRWNFNFAPIFEQHNWRKNLTPKCTVLKELDQR